MATATDLEAYVQVRLSEPEGEAFMLNPKALEMLRQVRASSILELALEGKRVRMSAGALTAHLETVDAEEYPPFPQMSEEPIAAATLPGDRLVEALVAVAGYAATEASRPILTGVLMHTTEAGMTVVAVDGFRLSHMEIPLRLGEPGLKRVVPGASVRKLARLWKQAAERDVSGIESVADLVMDTKPMRVEVWQALMRCSFGRVTFWTQLVQGTFPDYVTLLPTVHREPVSCWAEELYRAVAAVAEVARDGSGIVRLEWAPGVMTVSASATDEGEVKIEVLAETKGAGRIAFEQKYIVPALRGLTGRVEILTTTPSSPAVLRRDGAPDVVLMPMFVQWPGKSQAGQAAAAEGPVATDGEPDPPAAGVEGESPQEGEAVQPEAEAAPEGKPARKGRRKKAAG